MTKEQVFLSTEPNIMQILIQDQQLSYNLLPHDLLKKQPIYVEYYEYEDM
jgi:hypothetical protein